MKAGPKGVGFRQVLLY